jgi:hypothetical protein
MPDERPLERVIENKLRKELIKCGALLAKLNILGQRSWPDRYVIADNGAQMLIEIKRLGEDLTPLQRNLHKKLKRRGVPVYKVYTVAQGLQAYADGRARWQDYLDWKALSSNSARTKKKRSAIS